MKMLFSNLHVSRLVCWLLFLFLWCVLIVLLGLGPLSALVIGLQFSVRK